MRLVLLGGPGAGKGTQGKRLSAKLQIPLISTGEVLRNAIALASELGQQARSFVEKGELVPDELMIQFMRDRLSQTDTASGWLLEGYPRTAFQAEELDFLLDELQQSLNGAIYLEVPEANMQQRSASRGLPDDRPEIVQRRIELFCDRTLPILEYYDKRDRLLKIDGNLTPDQVHRDILRELNLP
ncbi:adenylate kinase [Desertifilum sp. FACHB-1129]|uniref:Adenylate kinase n=2 Tax=Desertifilum tharense IPPAS B-1220 TaxID=1781255 RepID=A0A1E5QJT6_9CYAN|nr:adenylate kinase [Desertifilum tharense]MBD2313537.1 adenylate kinase [Desertifilum sp. FACHB-1129]MBD2323869.1 adenylate kinase [Desertifilum sp. FACHB-866]MBD2333714.1 adenylate kinase [Desertifilum sp. FACHB-868]MDA0211418.1 adenylate kinase [Cyanobacteria bacterium FC1]OEJ74942.1 adenylate kinase [Desertifilum tharense IPPAS B-1220]